MIKKLLGNNKGSALVLVITVISILAILGSALFLSSLQMYKITLLSDTTDKAYIAAQSTLEGYFDYVDKLCTEDTFSGTLSTLSYSSPADKNTFGDRLAQEISNRLAGTVVDVDIANTVNKAQVTFESNCAVRAGNVTEFTDSDTYLIVPIAIRVNASYKDKMSKAIQKQVVQVRTFRYRVSSFQLLGAINTIGDVLVDNVEATVNGDIITFGSAPIKARGMDQSLFGGVLAFNNGVLNAEANIYTNSFIRSGVYRRAPDYCKINVKRDAVAQCIQAFGNGNTIAVFRNAYTFDDVEMNGENSLIAINGNYFGLSNNSAKVTATTSIPSQNHDDMSALINSAIIHYPGASKMDSPAKHSRIVVNGDVLINGGTLKVDDTGNVTGGMTFQLEDASVAYNKNTGSAYYKEFTTALSASYAEFGDRTSEYFTSLDAYKSNPLQTGIGGYGVIIQNNGWTGLDDTGFAGLIATGDLMRTEMTHGYSDDGSANPELNAPNTIIGFSNYLMAANRTLYFAEGSSSDDGANGFLNRPVNLASTFTLDNVEPTLITNIQAAFGALAIEPHSSYASKVSGILSDGTSGIQPALKAICNQFFSRTPDYVTDPVDPKFLNRRQKDFIKLFEDVTSPLDTHHPKNMYTNGTNMYYVYIPEGFSQSIVDDVTATPSNWGSNYPYMELISDDNRKMDLKNYIIGPMGHMQMNFEPFTITDTSDPDYVDPTNWNVKAKELYDNKFFLVACADPRLVIDLKGAFNGIIFTKGKVIVSQSVISIDPTVIDGVIIAAGTGEDPKFSSVDNYDDTVTPVVTNLPQITRESDLTSGEYAAVHFQRTSPTNMEVPTINFWNLTNDLSLPYDAKGAKKRLFDYLITEGIDLTDYFK